MKTRVNTGTLIEERDVDVASIPANGTNFGNITVNGARGGMVFAIALAESEVDSGLLWQGISLGETDGVVPIRFINTTAAPIDPATIRMRFIAL